MVLIPDKKYGFYVWLFLLVFSGLFYDSHSQEQEVSDMNITLIDKPDSSKINVFINGSFFTAYHYSREIEKPVFFPLKTSTGITVTRHYPILPKEGERVDHPHHTGLWLNFGDVNGFDFWNNSFFKKPKKKHKLGYIQHATILKMESGTHEGVLKTKSYWISEFGDTLLEEISIFSIRGNNRVRSIERTTQLTALGTKVSFADNKEGLFAMRVARPFEAPINKPILLTDMYGNPKDSAIIDNNGVNGTFLGSNGLTNDAVWGTRNKWVSLSAAIENDSVSIIIFDHPSNPNYPAYWMTRGYGLFAIDNFGSHIFDSNDEPFFLALERGQKVLLKHKIIITSKGCAEVDEIERWHKSFSK